MSEQIVESEGKPRPKISERNITNNFSELAEDTQSSITTNICKHTENGKLQGKIRKLSKRSANSEIPNFNWHAKRLHAQKI